jgi:nitroreductase
MIMNIIDVIKTRKSCRTFNSIFLSQEDKAELESFILKNSKGLDNEIIDFSIIENKDASSELKINYGMIQGHKTFVLGTSKSTPNSRVNYGYLMEKLVLKATEMNIASCWIGVFDQTYFKEIIPEKGFEIPSILIIGYADKQSAGERLVRFAIKAHKRNDWETLFFDYQTKLPLSPDQLPKYSDSLEMLRLGPSAGNSQPWRVFFDETTNEFHFFKNPVNKKYDVMGLHEIDMGIAVAHFELTSNSKGLKGVWDKYENIQSSEDLQYIMSWRCIN